MKAVNLFILCICLLACKKDDPEPPAAPAGPNPNVISFNGTTYNVVSINGRRWFKENLRTTAYTNGDPITTGLEGSEWENTTDGAYYTVTDPSHHLQKYGRLYNFYAVTDPRGICPVGWHVPTDDDWKEMEIFLGMPQAEADGTSDSRGESAQVGNKIRSNQWYWSYPDVMAQDLLAQYGSNISGFSAMPGGVINYNGDPLISDGLGYFWTSTEVYPTTGRYRYLTSFNSGLYRQMGFKSSGKSCRCMED